MIKIDELVGIIEGISYDEVINEYEVIRIRQWINNNYSLKHDQEYSSIIETLESIIEDNVIDDEEREFLIAKTNAYIREHQTVNESLNIVVPLSRPLIKQI